MATQTERIRDIVAQLPTSRPRPHRGGLRARGELARVVDLVRMDPAPTASPHRVDGQGRHDRHGRCLPVPDPHQPAAERQRRGEEARQAVVLASVAMDARAARRSPSPTMGVACPSSSSIRSSSPSSPPASPARARSRPRRPGLAERLGGQVRVSPTTPDAPRAARRLLAAAPRAPARSRGHGRRPCRPGERLERSHHAWDARRSDHDPGTGEHLRC